MLLPEMLPSLWLWASGVGGRDFRGNRGFLVPAGTQTTHLIGNLGQIASPSPFKTRKSGK
ncbi:MAG: hypothetical protein PVS2B2_21770 [Candidatus Acidiferrum sp.]